MGMRRRGEKRPQMDSHGYVLPLFGGVSEMFSTGRGSVSSALCWERSFTRLRLLGVCCLRQVHDFMRYQQETLQAG